MENFKEDLIALKMALKAKNDTQLAYILKISYSAIDGWKRRKKLPSKYNKYIQSVENTYKNDNLIDNILLELNQLPEKKQEYFYHLIKAEVLRESC